MFYFLSKHALITLEFTTIFQLCQPAYIYIHTHIHMLTACCMSINYRKPEFWRHINCKHCNSLKRKTHFCIKVNKSALSLQPRNGADANGRWAFCWCNLCIWMENYRVNDFITLIIIYTNKYIWIKYNYSWVYMCIYLSIILQLLKIFIKPRSSIA